MGKVVVDAAEIAHETAMAIVAKILETENPADVTVICSDGQDAKVYLPDGVQIVAVPAAEAPDRFVISTISGMTPKPDRVYSYSDSVAAFTEAAIKADFHNLRTVYGPPRKAWPEHVVPLTEAIDLLMKAVANAGPAGLRETAVRPVLSAMDPRFEKQRKNSLSSPGVISKLVHEAELRGLVIAGDGVQGDRRLKSRSAAKTQVRHSSSSHGLRGPTTSFVPATRSQELVNLLRGADMGPFMEGRHHLYDKFEHVFGDADDKTLTGLIRAATKAAAADPPAPLISNSKATTYPWQRVRRLFEVLQKRCPIAKGHDGLLTPSFTAGHSVVVDLVPSWRQRLDGELIIELVRLGAALSYHDLADLAGALMGDRSDESVQFISQTLMLLLDDGSLSETEEFVLTVPNDRPVVKLLPAADNGAA